MSLSNPQLKNPATRFMQWRGGAENVGSKAEPEYEGGRVTYYDKEDQQEYEVDLPLRFTVLDELHTITGYSEKDRCGFWSNEVRDLKDKLVVRTKAGIVAQGAYGNISDGIKSKGAKYAKSVYIAFKDESGELVIGNIKFSGASLTAWIEFQKKFDVSVAAVSIEKNPDVKTKGKTKYFIPALDGLNLNAQTKKEAIKLDEELQRYLNTYFSQKPSDDDGGLVEEDDEPENDTYNVKGIDSSADEDEIEEDDEEEETPAPAPKKKAAAKKADVNISDVEF